MRSVSSKGESLITNPLTFLNADVLYIFLKLRKYTLQEEMSYKITDVFGSLSQPISQKPQLKS